MRSSRVGLSSLLAMAVMGSGYATSASPWAGTSHMYSLPTGRLAATSRSSGMTAARQKRAAIKAKNRKRNKARN